LEQRRGPLRRWQQSIAAEVNGVHAKRPKGDDVGAVAKSPADTVRAFEQQPITAHAPLMIGDSSEERQSRPIVGSVDIGSMLLKVRPCRSWRSAPGG